jgi:hypothetical protein
LQQACNRSPVVSHIEERVVDTDILSVRVHLTAANTFINVFYNVTTDKVAFALVEGRYRLYGVETPRWDGIDTHSMIQINTCPALLSASRSSCPT